MNWVYIDMCGFSTDQAEGEGRFEDDGYLTRKTLPCCLVLHMADTWNWRTA